MKRQLDNTRGERIQLLNNYCDEHSKALTDKYGSELMRHKIMSVSETRVDGFICKTLTLDNGATYDAVYRRSSHDEQECGVDLGRTYGDYTFTDYCEKFVVGQTIKSVSIGFPYSDGIFVFAELNDVTLALPVLSVVEIEKIILSK